MSTWLRGLRLSGPGLEGEEEGAPRAPLATRLPTLVIVAAIGLLALAMRLHDYALAPSNIDAPDEYSFTWTGMQLLRGHAPAGTSGLAAYGAHGQDMQLFGKVFHLVTPWLDRPPLFSLFPGGMELIRGYRLFGEMSPQVMRLPSVALGVLTVVLAYLLARRLLPPTGAMFAGFLVAADPGMVLLSRLALPETMVAPMLLGAILLATPPTPESLRPGSAGVGRAPEMPPRRAGISVLLLLCVTAPLVAVGGLAVPLAAVALLLSRGLGRQANLAAGAGALGVVLWTVYGLALGGTLVFRVIAGKMLAGGGILTAVAFMTGPIGAGRPMIDPWFIFGWAALAYLAGNAKRRHRYRAVLWAVALYVALVTPFLSAQDLSISGWSRLPVMPLLLIASVSAVFAAVREGQLLVPALALVTAGAWSIQWLFPQPVHVGPTVLLALAAVCLVPLAIAEVRTRASLREGAIGIWTALALMVLAGDTLVSWNLISLLGKPGLVPI